MGFCLKLIIISSLITSGELTRKQTCLTGYMTDLQDWVDEDGELTQAVEYQNAIDLSSHSNPLPLLQQKVSVFKSSQNRLVKYLSLARCRLSRIPPVFHIIDSNGRFLYDMVEYVTFYGNFFLDISSAGEQYDVIINATEVRDNTGGFNSEEAISVWSSGFQQTRFPRLKELDLRNCAIRVLSENLFNGMPQLEYLYLGENNVFYIDADAFKGLDKLVHLDLSRNMAYSDRGHLKQMVIENFDIFKNLKNLSSLDLSYTKITQKNIGILRGLGKQMKRLSLCDAQLRSLPKNAFNETSLRILDLSYNDGILSFKNSLNGVQDTLQILYAKDVGLTSVEIFKNFKKLEVLRLNFNEISIFPTSVAMGLENLQILDLSNNRLITWFEMKFSLLPELKFLSVTHNNINIISEEMVEDFANINYLAISGNFLVCNCHSRDLLEVAATNEHYFNNTAIKIRNSFTTDPAIGYHRGFEDFNKQIFGRRRVEIPGMEDYDNIRNNSNDSGKFLLTDYSPLTYTCLYMTMSKTVPFTEISGCRTVKNLDYDEVMSGGQRKLIMLLILPCILLPLMIGFIFRRNFRYCLITMRNSAMLSMISDKETFDVSIPEGIIYHYDVFVSYCDEDRGWVLDHLLPHLESDCNISACLHERDFQVGLSILENIVVCMDRSRSIMLIISQRFLKSQWCQFEMHLAQHRLLETRREDLTLVLLEEIPRRLRPNTLHYLMLTKTYIVWPKDEADRSLFWKRLKKSLMTQKLKHRPIDSVA